MKCHSDLSTLSCRRKNLFSDDCTVASNVPLLLLHTINIPIAETELRRSGRGYASGCRHVDHGTVLFVLLQRVQDSRPFRRNDLQNDHGRPATFRFHLFGFRDGVFPR